MDRKAQKKRYFAVSDGSDTPQNQTDNSPNKNWTKTKMNKMGKKQHFKMKTYKTYSDNKGKDHQQEVFKVDVKKTEILQRQAKFKQNKGNVYRNLKNTKVEEIRRAKKDPFPGDKPVPTSKMKKYQRGKTISDTATRSAAGDRDLKVRRNTMQLAAKESARTELLMTEEQGFLETEDGEDTTTVTQHDLASVVDVTSAQKFFELKMTDFGPYHINYTRNGRFLLVGGAKGHVAAIDWMTKRLLCEINVMETINDVRWLHQETMYAVAQKQWTYIYDNQGIELHCLKKLDCVVRMEFLPYHFLLASANSKGYLSYIDVSVGEKVAGYNTKMGRLDVMCQNPSNALVALGHTGGTVTQWCPKMKEPVVKMLCHNSGVRSVAIDKDGLYMATSGIDRTLKVWDLRTWKMLQSYKIPMGAGQMSFSQKGLLATGMGSIVQVYQDCCRQPVTSPYLVHNLTSSVKSVQFCPYEDVLGVGHGEGFSSLLIPGAGEPNFDALESNPYQTKKQRRETEVKMLLEKIPADMIHLDKDVVVQVDKKGLEEKIDEHNKSAFLKPMRFDYEPRHKKKGRSKGQKLVQRKKGVIEEHKRKQIKQLVSEKQTEDRDKTVSEFRTGNVLDRFKRKE